MWSLRNPTDRQLNDFLAEQAKAALSYVDVGATANGIRPAKYDYDSNCVLLGRGNEVFRRACIALQQWRQFPQAWTRIIPDDSPPKAGNSVVLIVRALGLWWWNSARIVYTVDESGPTRRFGFAYGTLPEHVERGEERFTIEMNSDGEVWYAIRAFSRPRMLAVRIGYPIARRLQRKFVRDSKAEMLTAVDAL